MKLISLLLLSLVVFGLSTLILTMVETKTKRENCEQFRYKAIQDVPKACFSYFEKEFK